MRALCKLLDPIMDMLQMVDSDTRQIGKILRRYDEMIVRCLSACAVFDKDEQDALLEVFDKRRTMFKLPAHVAAMMLDPEFRKHTMPDDEEMQYGLKVALVQFGYPKGLDQHNEVLTAIDKFHAREPSFDDVAMDRVARSYTHPACFWKSKEKSGSSTEGLYEQGVRIVARPSAPSMGTRSIGTVDGARHTAMTEYEDRHGSALPTKNSDVHATRAAKASLFRARKKASTRKASRSSPHMRSHIGRSGVVYLEDGEIAPDDDALDVGGRAATTADNFAREGAGDTVAGQNRRGSVLIVHGDSTDVAPGETTDTDDARDSDYVPKLRTADGDDGGARRVRRRT
ncbi:hypothetical protein CBR_g49030 [Chara braunii]|uniref:Uncharacterized protein n=1 Tax=Chara braunii TaxID=69332 RepID=A0A388M406_CHABU|nr:hypothetical protein CBR_g49030 [Chara braunii]|eukprot:GBG89320.1 hypothetical protein CBR_g49030 [Chara braunii]